MEKNPIVHSSWQRKKWNVILLKMKLLTVLIFAGTMALSASSYSQRTKIDLRLQNSSLKEILGSIEQTSEFIFIYNANVLNTEVKKSINVRNERIENVLKLIFEDADVFYRIDDRQILLYKKNEVKKPGPSEGENEFEQPTKRQISGKVSDKNGEPIPGATVIVKGTTIGTITDFEGIFSLDVPEDTKILAFSFVGYSTMEVTLGKQITLNIMLQEAIVGVEEVVVVGYGTQKKETVTGAISTIRTEDLVQSPQANISNALVGRLPGLFAVQRSGEPGNDQSTIRIRGIGTFAGDEFQNPLVMVDGIESSNYNNIDPNEIESISILKDASSTAVYGVRGANGVLLITTKRGVTGKPKISLSSSVAQATFPFLRSNMDSYNWATSYNKALAYDSYVTGNYNPLFSEEDIELYKNHQDPIFHPDVDWYKLMLKNSSMQTHHNLNIRGGTEKVKYFFSLGYFYQNGMFNTDVYDGGFDAQLKYNRYNLRSNFDFDITKRLKLSVDISTQIDDNRGPNWGTSLFMEALSSKSPVSTPGVVDGKIISLNSTYAFAGRISPIVPLDKGWDRNFKNNLDGAVRLNYDLDFITKGLSVKGAISYKNFNNLTNTFAKNGIIYEAIRGDDTNVVYIPSDEVDRFSFAEQVSKNRRIYLEMGMAYDHQFNDHHVTGLVLYNQSKYHSPALQYLVPNGYQGIVGRLTYDYKSRYLLEYNIGYNGTENFARGNRFGFFPAYSLGWVLSEENFFPKNDYLTFIKIRATYGEVGNDKIGGDRFLYRQTAYLYEGGYYFGEVGSNYQQYQASTEGKQGNPDLTWEVAKKRNLGVELRLLDSKISVTADWFAEKRDNILWNKGTIPVIFGAEFPAYNLGKMKNSGFDGDITFNNKIKNFHYFIKANYTYAHNEIEFQDEVSRPFDYQYRTGQRYGQFFGWVAEGLFNTWAEVNDVNRPVYMWSNNKIQPGDISYKDVNGDGLIDNDDQVPIGYSNFPEKIFGLSFGGEYKGFDFSILFQGATNVSTLPSRRSTRGFYSHTGAVKDLIKSWDAEKYEQGLPIAYPRLSASDSGHNYVSSTYWLEDASYVRLKNVELGYKLQGRLLKQLGLSSVRLYMNGNNLITWCNLFPGEDPEFRNGTANEEPYPVQRICNLGFNINF